MDLQEAALGAEVGVDFLTHSQALLILDPLNVIQVQDMKIITNLIAWNPIRVIPVVIIVRQSEKE
ncbi:uncharacterized protein LOC112905301 isoform X2 [Agrilus planipennis]|uniref:Uncharacterized protein LOC112905301 isoform X2 n=1 Tax=Agrilus planipennis TaxID=224129 RepID=A0A7F5RB65_AGRPL|nr:uncharacterized protein LOC112905301 isoform X2 [Agrilus planipennis]